MQGKHGRDGREWKPAGGCDSIRGNHDSTSVLVGLRLKIWLRMTAGL